MLVANRALARFVFVGSAALLASACMSSVKPAASVDAASHIEAIPKGEGSFHLLGNGRVRIDARGEFQLDREDAKNLYVRVFAPGVSALRVAEPDDVGASASALPPLPEATRLRASSIGEGLPHSGQWRDHFAVADLLGEGSPQIVFAPSRKTLSAPQVFRRHGERWERAPLAVPPGRYDYGAASVGDIDGDGRADLVMATHLGGFSALLGQADGSYRRSDTGLPQRASTDFAGSGHTALVLPTPPGQAAPFVLLQEAVALDKAARRAPGLALYRSTDHGFVAAPIGRESLRGTDLDFAPATAGCPAKLAVALASSEPPQVFESADLRHFTQRRLDGFTDRYAYASAVALSEPGATGCGALAVAYQVRVGKAWHAKLEVYRDDGSNWTRVPMLDMPGGAPFGALRFVPGDGVERLAVLDGQGTLRLIDLDASGPVLSFQQAAPTWRAGCSGSDLQLLPTTDNNAFQLVASFAGEPSMGQFDRCKEGGGIEAWRFSSRSAQ